MNIAKNLNQYDENYITFCEPIKNTIINDSTFIRILYSTPILTLNGIYLLIPFNNNIVIEKQFNKCKYSFNINNYTELIEKIKVIEENILKKIDICDKIPQFKIYEQFISGNIKIFFDYLNNNTTSTNNLFILKISGIWENQTNYGLTFKFIKIIN
jgi:hypothetical protein